MEVSRKPQLWAAAGPVAGKYDAPVQPESRISFVTQVMTPRSQDVLPGRERLIASQELIQEVSELALGPAN